MAWPTTVVVALLIFRKRLSAWFDERPARLKTSLFEIEWDRSIAAAQAQVDPDAEGDAVGEHGRLRTELAGLVRTHPVAAVLEAYRQIEGDLTEMFTEAGIEPPRRGAVQLARFGVEQGMLRIESARALQEISTLRNVVAHGRSEVSQDQATEYLDVVDIVRQQIAHDKRDFQPVR